MTEQQEQYPHLCGKCMHSSNSHEPHNGHFMHCAVCGKLCDKDEFAINHSSSKVSISGSMVYQH